MRSKSLFMGVGMLCGLLSYAPVNATNPPQPATVTFDTTDDPGSWFDCSKSNYGCVTILNNKGIGEKSLAVIKPGDSVAFVSKGHANTLHTAVSLLYPTGAFKEPFDVDLTPPKLGGDGKPFTVQLTTPGLYVFFCDIHPYMFAGVIVDDNPADGFDLGKTVDLPGVGPTPGTLNLPTASDLALRLVRTFFVVTNPNNWQKFAAGTDLSWDPSYAPVRVQAYLKDGTKVDTGVAPFNTFGKPTNQGTLDGLMDAYFSEPATLTARAVPAKPGVGQVWVDTQFEKMKEKTKPGTATAVNAATFQVVRKVGLPEINMNNPHNMWTDKNQNVIYQTNWFDNTVTVFNRHTGELLKNVHVGPDPAHVMTRTSTDDVHVSLNGGNDVAELTPIAAGFHLKRLIPMGDASKGDTHPHAHWMSADGNMMVTPNEDGEDSSLYNFPADKVVSRTATGHMPIATGMMPDSSKYYVANFADSTLSVINIDKNENSASFKTNINLLANYQNPTMLKCGLVPAPCAEITGPIGGLPIQTPVSPDGKYAVTANTLTATITVIETLHDTVVGMLPCDAGCHGVQFGAKKGGGYYAYVSSKFSNRLLVIDMDLVGSGQLATAIVGSVLLDQSAGVHKDGTISDYAGMGGQGVLPIPVIYNGWVQNLPSWYKIQLTNSQKNPIGQ